MDAQGESPPQTPVQNEKVTSQTDLHSKAKQADSNEMQPAENIVFRKLTGFVGFANLPTQYHRKSLRKGFNLNLMVVGGSGLGKSTLINTIFNSDFYSASPHKGNHIDPPQTVGISTFSAEVEEGGVKLRLSIVDTPGFGDRINNDQCWLPILNNIENRFDAYLDAEVKSNRSNIVDDRIHALLYFIEPTGHSLTPLDIEVMKRLHQRVNLIPLIAKADTLTDEEVHLFKQRVLADLEYHQISYFELPRTDNDDEETLMENVEISSKFPFAVVGSNTEVTTSNGRKVRGRSYPWGTIEVDNPEHSDFPILRQMLIRTHMEELKEHTSNVLYEQYRTDKLIRQGVTQDQSAFKAINPAAKLAEQRSAHEQRLSKLESEMKHVFSQKVQEKEQKLKQSEEELYARHREMKDTLEKQRRELEEKKANIERSQHRATNQESEKTKKKGFSLR